MNAEDLLSSKILSNKDILIDLYSVVKKAAVEATSDPAVIAEKNNVCLLPLETKNVTRVSQRCVDSRDAEVIYFADALTVIGGAALNLYEFELQEFKTRKGIPELKDFLKKSTSDLDMVWWPQFRVNKPELTNMCATSQSLAIEVLARTLTAKLQEKFHQEKDNKTQMMTQIGTILGDENVYVSTSVRPVYPAGVWTVNCSFMANGISYKILDIAIHDTASGQKLDKYGDAITKLEPMENDPVYSTVIPNTHKSITQLNFEGKKVSVCNISEFIRQQLFAFSLLIREPSNRSLKALINYKRVVYIIELLNNIQSSNARNLNILQRVFKIPNYETRSKIISKIIESINTVIQYNNDYIINLCRTIEDRDNIINELYLIALNNKRRGYIQTYDNKKLEIESPIRRARRSKRQVSQNVKRNINQSLQQLDRNYNNKINELSQEINNLIPRSTKLLTVRTNTTIEPYDIATSSTTASINRNNYPKAVEYSLPSLIPVPPMGAPVPPMVSPVPPMGAPIPPMGAPMPYSRQNTRSSKNNTTRKISVTPPYITSVSQYLPPAPKRENIALMESYKKFAPPPPPPSYYSQQPIYTNVQLSVGELLKSSRLIYNPLTNKYSVYDVFHNMEINVTYDSKLNLYSTYDTFHKVLMPLYFNTTTGKYYPVYFYPKLNNYGYFNDSIDKIVQLAYNPTTYSYHIIGQGISPRNLQKMPQFQPLGYSQSQGYRRGGNKTKKNKN